MIDRKQLQVGQDKFLVSTPFFNFLIISTNKIGDFNKAKSFVNQHINKALKGEVERVREFSKKKIDFEI